MVNSRGVTLIELLIAGLLTGFVIFSTANVYVAGLKQSSALRDKVLAMDPKASVEALAKTVVVAHEFQLKNPANGLLRALWIRVDATVDINGVLTPRNTPGNPADDTWIKYRFLDDDPDTPGNDPTMKWRSDLVGSASENDDVAFTDALLVPNIHFQGGNPRCEFLSLPSGNPVNDRRVGIRLVTQPGGGGTRQEVYTEVALTAKPLR